MNPLTIAPAYMSWCVYIAAKMCYGGGSYGMWFNVNLLGMDDATNAQVFDNTELYLPRLPGEGQPVCTPTGSG